MSDQNNHIDRLTPELIESYLNGDLSHAEMHAIEKLMLNSDFDAEAMEGFETAEPHTIEADITSLQTRLDHRVGQKKSNFPTYLKIAASIILLAICTYVVVEFISEPIANKQISQAEEQQAPEVPPPSKKPETSEEKVGGNKNEQQSKAADLIVPEASNQSTDDRQKNLQTETIQAETPPQLALKNPTEDDKVEEPEKIESIEIGAGEVVEESFADVVIESDDDMEAEQQAREIQAFDQQIMTRSSAKKAATPKRKEAMENQLAGQVAGIATTFKQVVKGKVLSAEDSSPLPGVNVIVKGTTLGTVTDREGNYQISIPEKADSTLVFSFVGLETKELETDGKAIVEVEMEADGTALSEVVVTAYGVAEEKDNTHLVAKPIIGLLDYKKYLDDNVRYPENSKEKGKVTVRFKVNQDGSLSDFEIIRSMGTAFDAEAIRVIKEGPKWSPAYKGNTATEDMVKVKVKFDPEN